jgi:hypothetical protein
VDHGQVAGGGLFISRRKTAILLDAIEEALNVVPLLVEALVVVTRVFAIGLGGNNGQRSLRLDE